MTSAPDRGQRCSWCGAAAAAPVRPDDRICPCCAEHFALPPDGPSQLWLDRAPFPLMVLELYRDRRMIVRAVNSSLCRSLARPAEEVVQHLAGNVLGCALADREEGCGGSACSDCGLLQTAASCVQTRSLRGPAVFTPQRNDGTAAPIIVTALPAGGRVLIRLGS